MGNKQEFAQLQSLNKQQNQQCQIQKAHDLFGNIRITMILCNYNKYSDIKNIF